MPNKFLSNNELINLLEKATHDEQLALTKIFDEDKKTPYNVKSLQEKIAKEGGHGVVNLFRGQGTGYLDILDDVADSLKIEDIASYSSTVQYYDEVYYIKNEKDDKPESTVKRLYNREEATKLGLEYATNTEEKIIIALIKKSYELMLKQKEDAENKLLKLQKDKSTKALDIKHNYVKEKETAARINLEADDEKKEELERQVSKIQNDIKRAIKKEQQLDKDITSTKKVIKDTKKRINDFNNTINEVAKKFDHNGLGTLTGTAGIMVLANLGGFATYTFLTSMMSVISMGTFGFGAYTAATSLLSIMIGPVGWAGLGIFAVFSLGKPNMSKLMLIVATIGAIRQRIKYGNTNLMGRKSPLKELKQVKSSIKEQDYWIEELKKHKEDKWCVRIQQWAELNDILGLEWIKDTSYDSSGYFEGIPTDIKQLKKSTVLHICEKGLTDLPEDIVNIEELNELYLTKNKFKKLPEAIMYLENLTVLFLGGNKLSRLPEEIKNLKKLTRLNLFSNNFSTFPITILKLKELRKLNLWNNSLKVLPSEIGTMKQLSLLVLANNQLESLPNEIDNLTNLTKLNLRKNPSLVLTEKQKKWIKKLQKKNCKVLIDDCLLTRI